MPVPSVSCTCQSLGAALKINQPRLTVPQGQLTSKGRYEQVNRYGLRTYGTGPQGQDMEDSQSDGMTVTLNGRP